MPAQHISDIASVSDSQSQKKVPVLHISHVVKPSSRAKDADKLAQVLEQHEEKYPKEEALSPRSEVDQDVGEYVEELDLSRRQQDEGTFSDDEQNEEYDEQRDAQPLLARSRTFSNVARLQNPTPDNQPQTVDPQTEDESRIRGSSFKSHESFQDKFTKSKSKIEPEQKAHLAKRKA